MKAVLVPVAHGYGTSSRLLAVADRLSRHKHQLLFAAGESLRDLINQSGFDFTAIPSVNLDERSKIPPIVQLLTGEAADGFIDSQISALTGILKDFQADVIIFSQNNAAALAASIADIPSVSIFHPGVMEFRDFGTLKGLYLLWRKIAAVKNKYTLKKPVTISLLGDFNFIPSLPQLIYWPLLQPPAMYFRKGHLELCGALLRKDSAEMSPQTELKEELGFPADEILVYATIGGAVADAEFIGKIVDGLKSSGFNALLTAGRGISPEKAAELSSQKVKVIQYLPQGLRAVKACDILLWHGGHETMLEAVAFGRPALGVPFQYDQKRNVAKLAACGAAIALDRGKLNPETVADSLNELNQNPAWRQKALELKGISDKLGGAERIAQIIEESVG